jgi:hypothetical protein
MKIAGGLPEIPGMHIVMAKESLVAPLIGKPEWNLATHEDENSSKERAARVCLRTYFHLYTLCISISILIDGAHLTA